MKQFPAVLDLATLNGANGFRIDGIDSNDRSGQSAASAGDVNGDGFDDVIIGAPHADPDGKSDAGESYVVFGSSAGFAATIDLASLNGINGFRIFGIDTGDLSGLSVASAGDINGDGYDDLIVGAAGADSKRGESYIIFGSGAGYAPSFDLAALHGANGFRVDGINDYDRSGASVASAGDVNGDGLEDVIVGANAANGGAGESYVIFGSSAGFAATLDLSLLDGANGFRIDGIEPNDFSGRSVACAGDFNGDGYDDLIIGATGADPAGRSIAGESYVIFGSGDGFGPSLGLATLSGADGFSIEGTAIGDRTGHSVASAGDINGDGFDDIVIGAPPADSGDARYTGASYVVFGSDAPLPARFELAALDGTNGFRVAGLLRYDYNGTSVASAGDVNGDGFDDVIIGALGGNPGGECYVIFGSAEGFAANLDLATLNGSNGFLIEAVDRLDYTGISVSSAGDVNGDGFDDIIVGAYGADPGEHSKAGESYVVFGRAPREAVTRIGSAADQTIRGGRFDDRLLGEGGDDSLYGGAGDDVLDGGRGRDAMFGGRGDDVYQVGQAADKAVEEQRGGGGYDIVRAFMDFELGDHIEELRLFGDARAGTGNALSNRIIGGDFAETLDGLGGHDRIAGGAGADDLDGGDGRDLLLGQGGHDSLFGGGDRDRLSGGHGDDAIGGGGGDDVLIGDGGTDVLSGGAGADIFLFRAGETSGARALADRITDFVSGEDVINLRQFDADTTGSRDMFAFVGTAAFSGTAGELRYQLVGGEALVQGDVDGDGLADFAIRVENVAQLSAADFVL